MRHMGAHSPWRVYRFSISTAYVLLLFILFSIQAGFVSRLRRRFAVKPLTYDCISEEISERKKSMYGFDSAANANSLDVGSFSSCS